MADLAALCKRCGASHWRPTRAEQPILEAVCQHCGAVEWVGFLPPEWARYVSPLTLPGGPA